MGNWFTNLFGGLGNALGGAGKSIMGMFGGGGSPMNIGGGRSTYGTQNVPKGFGGMAMPKQGGGGNFLNSIFQNPGAGMAGLGVMGLGQMMNKPVKMPDFSQNPAVSQLMGWQNQASHPMDPNVQAAMQHTLDIQNEQQLRNLRDVYKNLRPGTDYTTDSAYQRDKANLDRQIAMNNADAMAGQQFTSNQQQLGNLTNMAQLGVGQQMGQAAIDAQRRQQQNEMFGNIGSMLLQQGIGMPDFMKLFMGR